MVSSTELFVVLFEIVFDSRVDFLGIKKADEFLFFDFDKGSAL